MTDKPKKPSRQVREGFNFAILAALKAEDWESHVLPVTVELRRFRDAQYRQNRLGEAPQMNWHLTVEADKSADVLGGWKAWHLYGDHPRPWAEISPSLLSRLNAIGNAAWAAGVRHAKVQYLGDAGFSGHELIQLEAEALKWPSTPPDSNQ